MMHPCKLFVEGLPAPERFDSVAQLAARIHLLRMGCAITTAPTKLTTHDFAGACVVIRFEREPMFLGFAVIGEPELDAGMQDQLLCGQLYRAQAA